MKLVNKETFLNQPVGTLYCTYIPCIFDELSVFDGRCGKDDFFYQELNEVCDGAFEFKKLGDTIPLNLNCGSRDGLFDAEATYAVLDKDDVDMLINKLTVCYNEAYCEGNVSLKEYQKKHPLKDDIDLL